MALSPFQRDRGTQQGRIQVEGAPEGSYVFELGHAALEEGTFNVGDFIEVSQANIDVDAQAALLRLTVNVRLPTGQPANTAVEWEFTARLNGTTRYTRRLRDENRNELTLSDIAIPTVAALGGASNTLAFRLTLVAA